MLTVGKRPRLNMISRRAKSRTSRNEINPFITQVALKRQLYLPTNVRFFQLMYGTTSG